MTQQGNYYSFLFQRYVPAPVNTEATSEPVAKQNEQPPSKPSAEPSEKPAKRPRGFAAMSPEKQKQIASQGGTAAHKKGTAHQFNAEEARLAGRKGGESVSQDREHMSQIGRKGGKKRAQRGKTSSPTQEENLESFDVDNESDKPQL